MNAVVDTIHLQDCIQGMRRIPDRSCDMILCDLPYGTTKNKWDVVIPFDALWNAYLRVIKDHGAIVLFCDGLFMVDLIHSNRALWRYNLIWDKQRGVDFLNANFKPMKCHESIAVFYKKKPVYHKQYWHSKPYKKTLNGALSDNYGKRNHAISESEDGRRNPLTILSFPKDAHGEHPTQKPLALLEWLIATYTDEGGIVLDSCMGVGSTCVAAVNTHRHYIGFEINPTYFDIACKRLDEAERIGDTCKRLSSSGC